MICVSLSTANHRSSLIMPSLQFDTYTRGISPSVHFPFSFFFFFCFSQFCNEVFLWKKGRAWPADKYKSDIQNGLSPFEGNPRQSRRSPGESTRKDNNKKEGPVFALEKHLQNIQTRRERERKVFREEEGSDPAPLYFSSFFLPIRFYPPSNPILPTPCF